MRQKRGSLKTKTTMISSQNNPMRQFHMTFTLTIRKATLIPGRVSRRSLSQIHRLINRARGLITNRNNNKPKRPRPRMKRSRMMLSPSLIILTTMRIQRASTSQTQYPRRGLHREISQYGKSISLKGLLSTSTQTLLHGTKTILAWEAISTLKVI